MCALTSDNDQLKQYYHESERTMAQLKRDNEELQQKVAVVHPPSGLLIQWRALDILSL